MSKYTTELRFLCETEAGLVESQGFNSIQSILEQSAPKIFNFDFPIFDENYRLPLEIKILRHYYTREISEETVGLWKLRLQDKLNIIMPYYNQLYESELIKFNPLYDADLSTDYEKENERTEEREDTYTETGNATTNYNETNVTDTDTTNRGTYSESINTLENKDIDRDTTNNGTDTTTEKITNADGKTSNTDVHYLDNEGITTVTDTDTTSANTQTPNTTVTTNNTDTKQGTRGSVKWNLYSDTPQGAVNGITPAWDSVGGNAYLTNATNDTDDETNAETNTGSGTTVTTGTVSESGSGTLDTTETVTKADESSTVTDYEETIAKEQNKTGTYNTTNTGTEDITEETTISTEKEGSTSDTGTIDTTLTKTGRSVTDTSKDSTNNASSSINGLENYIQHVVGKSPGKSYSAMLNEFRDTFLNIDRMIINDLSNLFFGLW